MKKSSYPLLLSKVRCLFQVSGRKHTAERVFQKVFVNICSRTTKHSRHLFEGFIHNNTELFSLRNISRGRNTKVGIPYFLPLDKRLNILLKKLKKDTLIKGQNASRSIFGQVLNSLNTIGQASHFRAIFSKKATAHYRWWR